MAVLIFRVRSYTGGLDKGCPRQGFFKLKFMSFCVLYGGYADSPVFRRDFEPRRRKGTDATHGTDGLSRGAFLFGGAGVKGTIATATAGRAVHQRVCPDRRLRGQAVPAPVAGGHVTMIFHSGRSLAWF